MVAGRNGSINFDFEAVIEEVASANFTISLIINDWRQSSREIWGSNPTPHHPSNFAYWKCSNIIPSCDPMVYNARKYNVRPFLIPRTFDVPQMQIKYTKMLGMNIWWWYAVRASRRGENSPSWPVFGWAHWAVRARSSEWWDVLEGGCGGAIVYASLGKCLCNRISNQMGSVALLLGVDLSEYFRKQLTWIFAINN